MPPWPARLHLGSPAPDHPLSRPKSRGLRSPAHQDQAFSSQYQDPPLLGVPVLASADSTAPSPPKQRPRHGRSHSNPFTSLFGNGKKGDRMADAEIQNDRIDTLNGPPPFSLGCQSKEHMAGANGGPPQATGKCSTCDSSIRLPQHPDSFRCQVCLMINDLKPSGNPLGEALVGENPNSTASFKAGVPKKGEQNS